MPKIWQKMKKILVQPALNPFFGCFQVPENIILAFSIKKMESRKRGEFLAPKSNVRYVPLTRDDTQHEKSRTLIRKEFLNLSTKYF